MLFHFFFGKGIIIGPRVAEVATHGWGGPGVFFAPNLSKYEQHKMYVLQIHYDPF